MTLSQTILAVVVTAVSSASLSILWIDPWADSTMATPEGAKLLASVASNIALLIIGMVLGTKGRK